MASEFRNLTAWQKAVALAVDVYRVCETFPRAERFGLIQQLETAAVSVPSNIAEGRGRSTARDYRNFLLHARGSTYEVETQIEIAKRLGYITIEQANALTEAANEVARLINGIVRAIDARSPS
jgi:four helix bundle protein